MSKRAILKILGRTPPYRLNKSPADHTFLLRSCITRARYLECPLYLNFYDFLQCFDKLWLEDCVISLYKLGLQNEFLPLIYKTNLEAHIAVKTPLGISNSFHKTGIVKQGSVTACCLCSASTSEFCDENKEGGMQMGKLNIKSLAYVDDVVNVNTNVEDSNNSHVNFCFFADKKKRPLNEKKCFMLPVNCKKTDPVPLQEVNHKEVEIKESVQYLGDIFNQKGDYIDLINDRTRKGTVCTVNAMALCNDSELGMYTLNSLLLLYKTVFLKTILYNSETWNNLTNNDVNKLKVIQNKYLKWMLHTPKGTCTSFTLLELGLLPISHVIVYRKLSFLHHILNLPDDDPVKYAYEDQKLYSHEPNWYNEVSALLNRYGLEKDEENIRDTPKDKWKHLIEDALTNDALESLNADCASKSKTANFHYEKLSIQPYFEKLSPRKARLYFQLRGGVIDLKCSRPYMYNDNVCRLCENGSEDIDHVVNKCTKVKRSLIPINNIYDLSEDDLFEMLNRVEDFRNQIDQKD